MDRDGFVRGKIDFDVVGKHARRDVVRFNLDGRLTRAAGVSPAARGDERSTALERVLVDGRGGA